MKDLYRIKTNVHPAVAKWIDETTNKVFTGFGSDDSKEFAYDLRKTNIYYIFQIALHKKKIKMPSKIMKKTGRYVPIWLLINRSDFYNLGWEISDYYQNRISILLYEMMMTDFCHHIAYANIYGGIAKDKIMDRIIVENLFEPSELTKANLQKYYQRKFLNTGKEKSVGDFKHYTYYYLQTRNQ